MNYFYRAPISASFIGQYLNRLKKWRFPFKIMSRDTFERELFCCADECVTFTASWIEHALDKKDLTRLKFAEDSKTPQKGQVV